MIEAKLKAYLTTVAPLTPLISTRLYAGVAEAEVVTPYCVYFSVSSGREYTHDRFSHSRPRLQVSIFGDTYAQVKSVQKVLITALEAWEYPTQIEGVIDLYEPSEARGTAPPRLYHVAVDFVTFYEGE